MNVLEGWDRGGDLRGRRCLDHPEREEARTMDPQRTGRSWWLRRRRDPEFEVWESAGDGSTFFMVASRLTRKEALAAAAPRATARPRRHVLVLDGRGALVYRTGPTARVSSSTLRGGVLGLPRTW